MHRKQAGKVPRNKSYKMIWFGTFFVSAIVYASTAHWYGITNIDTMGAAWPAWHFVHHGTLFLEADKTHPAIPWFYDSGGHLVSNRMAGITLVSIPAQALLAWAPVHPLTPAIATAVLLTSGAMGNLTLLLVRMGVQVRLALAAMTTVGLGTGFWTNASAELWPHGPDAFWLTTAMLAIQRKRLWLAGLCFAPAIWTRPHLAIVAAVIGLALAVEARQLRPLLSLGLPTSAAAVGLVVWNGWYFGAPSVGGGYAGREDALTATSGGALSSTLFSAAGSLVSPLHGLLIYSPFMLIAIPAAVRGIRGAPGWVTGSAVGGVLYLAVQWRLNSFTGGTGLYGYRLQLETIVLTAPLAVVGYVRWAASRPLLRIFTRGLCGLAIAVHVIGVYWYQPLGARGQDLDPWRTWEPWHAALSRGPAAAFVAGLASLIVIVLSQMRQEDWRRLRTSVNRSNGGPHRVQPLRVSAGSPS